MFTSTEKRDVPVTQLTSAAADHFLSSSNGAENGFFQAGLHVLRLFKRQAVNPLQSFFPLKHIRKDGTIKKECENEV